MGKLRKPLFLFSLLFGLFAISLASPSIEATETNADQATSYPRNGQSGTLLYVNGAGTYFKQGEADLAIYCFKDGASAWSEKISYRMSGDLLRAMIPYNNGESTTWSSFIICRYNPAKDPSSDGFGGSFNQTENISFSSLLYAQNTINITGYDGNGKLNYTVSTNDYYGIRGETHMYLDLSGFPSWEEGGAKFALYFAYPNSTNENRWSQVYSGESYLSSFCWKVEGQDNDHLYECIVPNLYANGANIWNMVIAVRFDPSANEPNWNNKWNQTQNLIYNANNHTANMIHISGWNDGYLDTVNIISQTSRLDFFGSYFLANATCSGDGKSDATTEEGWERAKAAYQHLSRLLQGEVWKCDPSASESLLAQAMERYDYIVLYKQYKHEDFINRKESPANSESQIATIPHSMNIGAIIGVVAIAVVTLASGIIIFVKVKRS